jgi:CBS domain containing-hemolysin-like protein
MPNRVMLVDHDSSQLFNPQERRMIERVLNLNQRTVSSIMTSRHDIEHIDLNAPEEEIRDCWRKTSIRAWW